MMLTKKCLVLVASLCVAVAISLYAGYKVGYEKGSNDTYLGSSATKCIYLLEAYRLKYSEDDEMARQIRYRLLFGTVIELDEMLEKKSVGNESQRMTAKSVVEGAAKFYWRYPKEGEFLLDEDLPAWDSKKFKAFITKYKPAEQHAVE